MPPGIERLAQNSLPLGVRESEASQTLSQTGATASQLQGREARPQEGALDCYRHHLFLATHSMSLGKSLTLWILDLPSGLERVFFLFCLLLFHFFGFLFFDTGFLCLTMLTVLDLSL